MRFCNIFGLWYGSLVWKRTLGEEVIFVCWFWDSIIFYGVLGGHFPRFFGGRRLNSSRLEECKWGLALMMLNMSGELVELFIHRRVIFCVDVHVA